MASATRKLRRLNKAKATDVLPELTGKMGEVLRVGQDLAHISAQIGEVNGKLVDLDSLILTINETRNLVTQSLEEGRAVHEEQARQRFVNLKMFQILFAGQLSENQVAQREEQLREWFDETLKKTEETTSEEPG